MIRLGIDLGGTKTEIIALDQGGRELLRRRVASPRGDYEATLSMIVRLVREAESALGAHGSVGIGTPGAISSMLIVPFRVVGTVSSSSLVSRVEPAVEETSTIGASPDTVTTSPTAATLRTTSIRAVKPEVSRTSSRREL